MPRVSLRSPDAQVVAIEGASGAGKTSVAGELARRLDAVLIPEAFDRLGRRRSLRFRDRPGLAEIERALLAEEGRRWTEATAHRRAGRPVVLDTGTTGPLTYSWGVREGIDSRWDVVSEVLRQTRRLRSLHGWGLPDLTFYLDVSEDVADARAARSPTDHPAPLRERHRRVGRFERFLYEREFPRRLPGRFGCVAGEGSPREVASGIRDRLERLGPVPPVTAPELDRFLDLFEGSGPSTGARRTSESGRNSPTGRARRSPHPNS
ncbi:MAG TPA: AAA family ATPase [Thermoplasmata archaeon]